MSQYRNAVGFMLTLSRDINKRLDAVQEIYDYSESKAISALLELLSNLPDLEKGLCRIQYGSVRPFTYLTLTPPVLILDQCKPSELYEIIEAFHCVANKFPEYHRPSDVGCDASILNSTIFVLPKLQPIVAELMGQLNHGAARAGKKERMWSEGSKYCDLVNRRHDVRAFSSPRSIPSNWASCPGCYRRRIRPGSGVTDRYRVQINLTPQHLILCTVRKRLGDDTIEFKDLPHEKVCSFLGLFSCHINAFAVFH